MHVVMIEKEMNGFPIRDRAMANATVAALLEAGGPDAKGVVVGAQRPREAIGEL